MNDRQARAQRIYRLREGYERALAEIEYADGGWSTAEWAWRADSLKLDLEAEIGEQRYRYPASGLEALQPIVEQWFYEFTDAIINAAEPPPRAV